MTEIKCGWNWMLVVLFVMLVPLLCLQDRVCCPEDKWKALSSKWLSVHLSWVSRIWVHFILLLDCIGLLSTLPLIPMPSATFLFALLYFQCLQPKPPQCQYYHGVTCISAEVNGFERGWFMCSRKNTDPGLVNLTSWLTHCCNGKTEDGFNSPKG